MNLLKHSTNAKLLKHISYLNINNNVRCSKNFSCLTLNNIYTKDTKLKFDSQHQHPSLIITRNFSYEQTILSFWKTISNSTPVLYIQQGLIEIHDFTGLPWWASIMLTTFLFRTLITLPLTIYQHKIIARIENITLEMPKIVSELKRETAIAMKKYNWTEKQARLVYNRSLKKQWTKLVVRDNCHPLKTLIVLWGQIPLWICQSVAIRNLIHMLPDPNLLDAKIIFTQLTVGGFGWIPNLTEVDHSLILPFTLGIINLSIIEIQLMLRNKPPSRLQRYATNTFRLINIAMIPIAATVPSGLCVYWVSSSCYGLLQNLVLLSPKTKRLFGVPKTPSENQNPYNTLVIAMKKRTPFLNADNIK